MDAYYAQVEMKKHNIPECEPMGVLQWNSVIAINYKAKEMGVTRGMNAMECLAKASNMKFVHVSTIAAREGKD